MRKFVAIFAVLLTMMVSHGPLAAQGYAPDVLELDGETTLAFEADDRVQLINGATIEFWVQPDWQEDMDYDPVILANGGADGYSYLVAMLRDRSGIGIISGPQVMVAPFDFTDGQMHHVAIIDYADTLLVFIDNVAVAEAEMAFVSLPSDGFWIGTSDGVEESFVGAIAGMRLWDSVVDPDVIAEFRLTDILEDESNIHPDLEWLIGVSDFANQDFFLQPYDEE